MSNQSVSKKRRAAALLALSVTLILGLPPAIAESGAAQSLKSITLQLDPATAVAQEKGFFKEEFDKIGIEEVNLSASGSAELLGAEAAHLNHGGIAVAQRMIYPAVVHRANGLDAVIVWVSEPSDKYRTPIIARADNQGINQVQDLDGRRFASSRVSCYWTAPAEVLTKAGLPLDSRKQQGRIRYQSIDSNAAVAAALLSGSIDATAVHLGASGAAALYTSGQVKVIGRSPDDGVYVNGAGRVSYFAMRSFAENYPQAIQAFLQAVDRGKAWARENPDEAAAIVAKATRVPESIARFQITDPSQYFFMRGEEDADSVRGNIKNFQAWYIKHGDDILSDRHLSDTQVDTLVDARFFKGGAYSAYR
ncbi:ABC transporter substrate-binding protein [Brenneria izadpanahii]|uniref:ABC transporter substrate-binding protein n=1 Tax=Brenneria izadpanahii TaxID=2722756 RepID=A0ABX7UZ80_9GAMM|nr:ABC transporter substrate-binding protein [Brenneria izadpanahii]QTF08958.1 ABC transporter substrate-binding protein [Brenneria izadpanahii]